MYLKCGFAARSVAAIWPEASVSMPGELTDVPTNSTAREPAPLMGS
jgi:hypothetical protein